MVNIVKAIKSDNCFTLVSKILKALINLRMGNSSQECMVILVNQ